MRLTEYARSRGRPELLSQWHGARNGVGPELVASGSHRKYWWQCGRGHEWQAAPFALVQGNSCPYCAGKRVIPGETDLQTLNPELAGEWHPTKNAPLTPRDIMPGSMKRVWWRCALGHEYQSQMFSRTQGTGCPYCAGRKAWPGFNDLATVFPALAREWHPTLNSALTPQQVTKGCHKQVWWQCSQGHSWRAVVYARAKENGTGCPVCAGTVRRKKPKCG